jgi:NADH:ubiquinone oxidoreductase subunit 2 (subunit N)
VTLLLPLLVVGALGSAASAWGLSRAGPAARAAAALGVVALAVIVVLALALETNAPTAASQQAARVVFDGRLVVSGYLRLIVALWALDALLLVFVAWLGYGLAGLGGLLPAVLAALTVGTIAFSATDLTLAAAAAGAAGLAVEVALLATPRAGAVEATAAELRVSLLGPALLIGVAAAAPVGAALVLQGVAAIDPPVAAPAEASAMVGLLALLVALVVAVRFGAIPFHIRVPRLADASPPLALPLLLAWVPVPIGVVALTIADRLLAPLALPLQGEQAIIVAVALATLGAAAVAALLQDDLRHAVGYLVVADGALILLGLASLDPASWGPARTWLVVLAASKTALLAWAAVVEARFETRSIPDLRGWMRRAPILAAALVLATVATYGLPGWVGFTARGDLSNLAAGMPWNALLILAGFATLPTYLRLITLGWGSPTSKVSRAAPERIVRGWRPEALPVEQEGAAASDLTPAEGAVSDPARSTRARPALVAAGSRVAAAGSRVAAAGSRVAVAARSLVRAMRRDQAELVAAAVLALAILAALTSWGALDISGAAAEVAPIVSGPSSD